MQGLGFRVPRSSYVAPSTGSWGYRECMCGYFEMSRIYDLSFICSFFLFLLCFARGCK